MSGGKELKDMFLLKEEPPSNKLTCIHHKLGRRSKIEGQQQQ